MHNVKMLSNARRSKMIIQYAESRGDWIIIKKGWEPEIKPPHKVKLFKISETLGSN